MKLIEMARGLLGNSKRGQFVDTFVEPSVSVLPNPVSDPDGYDRHFILEEERFLTRENILTRADLSTRVLEWARTQYPGSYGMSAHRLHEIKKGWLRDHLAEAKEDRLSWQQALWNGEWAMYVPQRERPGSKRD